MKLHEFASSIDDECATTDRETFNHNLDMGILWRVMVNGEVGVNVLGCWTHIWSRDLAVKSHRPSMIKRRRVQVFKSWLESEPFQNYGVYRISKYPSKRVLVWHKRDRLQSLCAKLNFSEQYRTMSDAFLFQRIIDVHFIFFATIYYKICNSLTLTAISPLPIYFFICFMASCFFLVYRYIIV